MGLREARGPGVGGWGPVGLKYPTNMLQYLKTLRKIRRKNHNLISSKKFYGLKKVGIRGLRFDPTLVKSLFENTMGNPFFDFFKY